MLFFINNIDPNELENNKQAYKFLNKFTFQTNGD